MTHDKTDEVPLPDCTDSARIRTWIEALFLQCHRDVVAARVEAYGVAGDRCVPVIDKVGRAEILTGRVRLNAPLLARVTAQRSIPYTAEIADLVQQRLAELIPLVEEAQALCGFTVQLYEQAKKPYGEGASGAGPGEPGKEFFLASASKKTVTSAGELS